jgi:hypothetical protein
VFSGWSGSDAASPTKAEGWESKVDDGGTGGNAEAMAQKGQGELAPGSRGGADMVFGILVSRVHKSKG